MKGKLMRKYKKYIHKYDHMEDNPVNIRQSLSFP